MTRFIRPVLCYEHDEVSVFPNRFIHSSHLVMPNLFPCFWSDRHQRSHVKQLNEDTDEFIELFDAGTEPLDVLNWQFTDGNATDIIQPFRGSQTTIPPQSYALIFDAEYADDYDLPPKTILLTTKNTTLGDGLQINDPITLFDVSGEKVITTYSPPFRAKNGISAERVDVTIGDVPENWKASVHPSEATPGRENSVSGMAAV